MFFRLASLPKHAVTTEPSSNEERPSDTDAELKMASILGACLHTQQQVPPVTGQRPRGNFRNLKHYHTRQTRRSTATPEKKNRDETHTTALRMRGPSEKSTRPPQDELPKCSSTSKQQRILVSTCTSAAHTAKATLLPTQHVCLQFPHLAVPPYRDMPYPSHSPSLALSQSHSDGRASPSAPRPLLLPPSPILLSTRASSFPALPHTCQTLPTTFPLSPQKHATYHTDSQNSLEALSHASAHPRGISSSFNVTSQKIDKSNSSRAKWVRQDRNAHNAVLPRTKKLTHKI